MEGFSHSAIMTGSSEDKSEVAEAANAAETQMPKIRVREDGSLGERNDVALAGLFHKMGWRGTVSTHLSFGENGACVGELVGEPNRGLACMFHMMNEARIGVGLAAVMLGTFNQPDNEAHARAVLEDEQARKLRRDLRTFLDTQLNDTRSAWDMQPDGSYVQRRPAEGMEQRGSQEILIELAGKRLKRFARLKKRKAKGVGGRNLR